MVKTSCVGIAYGQALDPQVKGDNAIRMRMLFGFVVDEGAIIVPPRIPRHGHLSKVGRRFLGEMGNHIRIALRSPTTTASCREYDCIIFDLLEYPSTFCNLHIIQRAKPLKMVWPLK